MANLVTIQDYNDCEASWQQWLETVNKMDEINPFNADKARSKRMSHEGFVEEIAHSQNMSKELVDHIIEGDFNKHYYGKLGMARNVHVGSPALDRLLDNSSPEIQAEILRNPTYDTTIRFNKKNVTEPSVKEIDKNEIKRMLAEFKTDREERLKSISIGKMKMAEYSINSILVANKASINSSGYQVRKTLDLIADLALLIGDKSLSDAQIDELAVNVVANGHRVGKFTEGMGAALLFRYNQLTGK